MLGQKNVVSMGSFLDPRELNVTNTPQSPKNGLSRLKFWKSKEKKNQTQPSAIICHLHEYSKNGCTLNMKRDTNGPQGAQRVY